MSWGRQKAASVAVADTVAQVTPMISVGDRSRLGDMLVSEHALLPEQLAGALNLQMESGRQLGTILVEQGLLDSRALTQALGPAQGAPDARGAGARVGGGCASVSHRAIAAEG